MEIQFGQIGNSLGTRVLGQKLRLKIEESLKDGQFITFNFEGVDSVSHSFADECFGKLLLTWMLSDLKSNSTFINANTLVKKAVAFTLKERAAQIELA